MIFAVCISTLQVHFSTTLRAGEHPDRGKIFNISCFLVFVNKFAYIVGHIPFFSICVVLKFSIYAIALRQ